jgi:hypothetical protein
MGGRIEKNGGRWFRRPKLTLSCSAEGKEGRKEGMVHYRVYNSLSLVSILSQFTGIHTNRLVLQD